jgi:hypothetical protein
MYFSSFRNCLIKSVSELVKQAIRNTHNLPVYLYDNENKELLQIFTNHKELIKEYNVSPKTLIKYLDSGKVWRRQYFITSNPMF